MENFSIHGFPQVGALDPWSLFLFSLCIILGSLTSPTPFWGLDTPLPLAPAAQIFAWTLSLTPFPGQLLLSWIVTVPQQGISPLEKPALSCSWELGWDLEALEQHGMVWGGRNLKLSQFQTLAMGTRAQRTIPCYPTTDSCAAAPG